MCMSLLLLTLVLSMHGSTMKHKIITQYTKDQLQLAAKHIGKATQGEESTAPRF